MDNNEIKKILIVQIGKIGDMILNTPLFSELKKYFPSSNITVLSSSINKDISLNHKFVDNIFVYNKNIFKLVGLLFKLRRNKFDIWIDSKKELSNTSAILVKWANPKKSFGFNNKKNIFDIDLNGFCNPVIDEHLSTINLCVLKYFGINYASNIKPSIFIPDEIKQNIENKIKDIKGYKILLNISAGNKIRYWNKNNWINLIKNLKDEYSIIITGAERDIELANDIKKELPDDNIITIKTKSILEFAELIKKCNLLITPDTSAVHIASCFDIPIIAFYNNVKWNIKRFAPLSTKKKIFISDSADSIDSIGVKEVLDAVKEI